jgi:hypothetical protein
MLGELTLLILGALLGMFLLRCLILWLVIRWDARERVREDREYQVADDLYLASVINGFGPQAAGDNQTFHSPLIITEVQRHHGDQ